MRVKVELDLSHINNGYWTPDNLLQYSNIFTVTVDECNPLPCNYNQVLTPAADAVMPEDMFVIIDGTTVTTTFEFYKDEVSERCSNPYQDLCADKTYSLKKVSDGTDVPGQSISCDSATRLCTLSISTTDSSLIGAHEVKLVADLPDSTESTSLEESYIFNLFVQDDPPCNYLMCDVARMVRPDTSYWATDHGYQYLLPSNISIWTDNNWGDTQFDNWNDTNTELCYKEPGCYQDPSTPTCIAVAELGNPQPSPGMPICGPDYDPIYTLVDFDT